MSAWEERLELGVWHSVLVVREAGQVSLTVDSQVPVTSSQTAVSRQTLSLHQSLWLGGLQDSISLPASLGQLASRGLVGCLTGLTINSLPVQLLYSAVATVNLDTCQEIARTIQRTPADHAVPAFSGHSYLAFNSSDSLLVWAGGANLDTDSDFLMLEVVRGRVQFSFNLGSGILRLEYNTTRVDDGRWHRVRATRLDRSASLLVDNGETITGRAPGYLTQLNTKPTLYLGGLPQSIMDATNYRPGVYGCIAEFSVGNKASINMLASAANTQNVDICRK